MRFKLWIATAAVLAGLVLTPGTASAHGNGEARWFYDMGPNPWPASQVMSQDHAAMLAYRTMQIGYFVKIENSPPNRAVFWARINNTAAKVLVWNAAGRVHVCTVDHDQTYTNGRWHTGINVRCTNN